MQARDNNTEPSLITWVIVTDTQQAQIYVCNKMMHKIALGGSNKHHLYTERPDYVLQPLLKGMIKSETIKDFEVGHDQRGQSSSSNSPTHNTYEPRGNIDEEIKHRFAREITDIFEKECTANNLDRFILVAPAEMITILKNHWGTNSVKKLAGTLAKNLVQFRGATLLSHLRDILGEAYAH